MGNKLSSKKFEDVYIKGTMVGKGAFATVHAAKLKAEPTKVVAAKILPKEHVSRKELRESKDEVDIMKKLDHPNVVKLYDVFDSKKKLVLVMEYCSGGQLLKRIVKMKHYTEKDAAHVIYQIVSAVKHMHEVGVTHRDLKPENILYATKAHDSAIKISDFGLSKFIRPSEKLIMTQACGTPSYVAPEVIARKPGGYDNKCDLWSVGVILYVLLSGYPPFYGKKLSHLLKRIKNGIYDFKPEPFKDVSDEAKAVIRKLLVVDPKKRLSASELLQEPWVCGRLAPPVRLRSTSVQLKKYYTKRKFRTAVKMLITLGTLYDVAKGDKKFVMVCGQRHFIDKKKYRPRTQTRPRSTRTAQDLHAGFGFEEDSSSIAGAVDSMDIESSAEVPDYPVGATPGRGNGGVSTITARPRRGLAKKYTRRERRPRSGAKESILFKPGDKRLAKLVHVSKQKSATAL